MRRIITTTTMMLLASTAMAAAADLSFKAPAYIPPAPLDSWTSFYAGLSGGGGWANNSIGTLNAGNFGTGNLLGLVTTGTFTASGFAGPGTTVGSMNQSGYTFGGFFGAQKQRGNWVLGIEADIDTTGIKASTSSSGINHGEIVGTAVLLTPTVTTNMNGITSSGPGVAFTGTGTASIPLQTLSGSATVASVPVTSTGSATVAAVPVTVSGTIGAGAIPVSVSITLLPGAPPVTLSGSNTAAVPITATGTVPGQTAPVTTTGTVPGQTAPVTVTLPAQSVPVTVSGTTAGLNVTTNPGQTAPGVINTKPGFSLIQAGVTAADVTRSVSVTTKIEELSSVRGKVGFIAMPNWLLYGTGGIAFASTSNSVTLTQQIAGGTTTNFSSSNVGTMLGWTAGVGIDWKLSPDWVLGVLYQHYEFPKNTLSFNGGTVGFSGGEQSVDTIKGRLSYHFMF